ncbi:Murein DD-endopeptidase MepM [BD1-7 clade bacterium]|uniref:Murein DD-endopeptidase MepM n=1 Tax=BD1-7 clade bacterium TaxID=2029982 RepID=A0A5S9MNV8_9GAMM|nr:Murein DD-endopeptidase MepM [BD1-7 clade bacterium]CAA0085492.1 Murein DD-endopeptidase MepM [BD1-7 clade bacterium]
MRYLSHIKNKLNLFPKAHLIIFCALSGVLLVSQLLMQDSPKKRVSIPVPISIEKIEKEVIVVRAAKDATYHWKEETVRSGDSLARIFKRVGLSPGELHRIMASDKGTSALLKIHPGHKIRFGFDENNTLALLRYEPSLLEYYEVTRHDADGAESTEAQTSIPVYHFEHIVKQPEIRLRYLSAEVTSSLFLAAQKADISQGLTMSIANILGGVVDFALDVRPGDTFDVLYEEKYLDNQKIGNGNILATSYTNQGEVFTAFRYEMEDGATGFFSEDGISMRKPFLRAPLDFTRISSNFNLRRKHPIHKKIRAHRGTDYVAPRGTPIFSAGDGRVLRSGYSRANGNYVFIRHGEKYTTKYLHLDKRYVKTGQRVKQRDVIGTLGSTGYSTGPHLHYEFLVNGVHRNPRTVFKKLPTADPVPKKEQARFNEQIKYLKMHYENLQVATNNSVE